MKYTRKLVLFWINTNNNKKERRLAVPFCCIMPGGAGTSQSPLGPAFHRCFGFPGYAAGPGVGIADFLP